jgi:hypothetical protein
MVDVIKKRGSLTGPSKWIWAIVCNRHSGQEFSRATVCMAGVAWKTWWLKITRWNFAARYFERRGMGGVHQNVGSIGAKGAGQKQGAAHTSIGVWAGTGKGGNARSQYEFFAGSDGKRKWRWVFVGYRYWCFAYFVGDLATGGFRRFGPWSFNDGAQGWRTGSCSWEAEKGREWFHIIESSDEVIWYSSGRTQGR